LAPPVGEQVAEKVNPGEIGSDEQFELLSADEHHSTWRIDEHDWRALCESRFGSKFCGYNQSTSIAHRY